MLEKVPEARGGVPRHHRSAISPPCSPRSRHDLVIPPLHYDRASKGRFDVMAGTMDVTIERQRDDSMSRPAPWPARCGPHSRATWSLLVRVARRSSSALRVGPTRCQRRDLTYAMPARSALARKLGLSVLSLSGSPVSGEVGTPPLRSPFLSHSSIARRSYVCPSAALTGSCIGS